MTEFIDQISQIATDPLSFFRFFGYSGLAMILFAETGLFGFFLPGDSLLITLGLISVNGEIDVHKMVPILTIATILGDHFSYYLGLKFSPWIYKNSEKLFINEEHLKKAVVFYEAHGGKTIMISKFVAFVRTFAPFVAGASGMKYFRFMIYDIIGAIVWVAGLIYLGHYIGKKFDFDIKEYFHYFVIFLGILIISPLLFKFFKKKS